VHKFSWIRSHHYIVILIYYTYVKTVLALWLVVLRPDLSMIFFTISMTWRANFVENTAFNSCLNDTIQLCIMLFISFLKLFYAYIFIHVSLISFNCSWQKNKSLISTFLSRLIYIHLYIHIYKYIHPKILSCKFHNHTSAHVKHIPNSIYVYKPIAKLTLITNTLLDIYAIPPQIVMQ